jgi:quercetin dioxygenase-like cupin family protein
MAFRVLPAAEALWRPSNLLGVLNTDLAGQLGASTLAARLWRVQPGEATSRHRHVREDELYLLLEGRGRIRAGDELFTLEPLSAVYVEADTVRQVFNDTDADALWLVVGAPPEAADLTPDERAHNYPDGPRALPPELS